MDTMGESLDSRTAPTVLAGPFTRSRAIGALSAALAKAQGEIQGASKDKTNPHFKSAYADLASIWEACRDALSKNGLAVLQPVSASGASVTVATMLSHSSGEWVCGELTMTATQNTPQGIGSCITYARRYALASMVGVAPEDDDANEASKPTSTGPQRVQVPDVPKGFEDWLIDLESVADEGMVALEATWKKSQPYMRKHLLDTAGAKWTMLKAKAAAVKAANHA